MVLDSIALPPYCGPVGGAWNAREVSLNDDQDNQRLPCRIRLTTEKQAFRCADDQTILAAMQRSGQRGIPVGCRGGGCGVCRVRVLSGLYEAMPMSYEHVDTQARQAGWVLACRILPLTDLLVEVGLPLRRRIELRRRALKERST